MNSQLNPFSLDDLNISELIELSKTFSNGMLTASMTEENYNLNNDPNKSMVEAIDRKIAVVSNTDLLAHQLDAIVEIIESGDYDAVTKVLTQIHLHIAVLGKDLTEDLKKRTRNMLATLDIIIFEDINILINNALDNPGDITEN